MKKYFVPILLAIFLLATSVAYASPVRAGVSDMYGSITWGVKGDRYPIQVRSTIKVSDEFGLPVPDSCLMVVCTPLVGNAVGIGAAPMTDLNGLAHFNINYSKRGLRSGDQIRFEVTELYWLTNGFVWDRSLDSTTNLTLTIP